MTSYIIVLYCKVIFRILLDKMSRSEFELYIDKERSKNYEEAVLSSYHTFFFIALQS